MQGQAPSPPLLHIHTLEEGAACLGDTVACLLEAGHLDIPVEEAHLRNQEVLPVVHNRRAEEGCHKGEDSHQGAEVLQVEEGRHKGEDSHQGVEGHHKGVDSHRAEGGLQEPEEEGHLLLEEVGTLVEEA